MCAGRKGLRDCSLQEKVLFRVDNSPGDLGSSSKPVFRHGNKSSVIKVMSKSNFP